MHLLVRLFFLVIIFGGWLIPLKGQEVCNNLQIYTLKTIRANYYNIDFTKSFTDLKTCNNYLDERVTFASDCNPCRAQCTIYNNTDKTYFYIVGSGIFDGSLYNNDQLVTPFVWGDKRKGWKIEMEPNDTIKLGLSFYTEKKRTVSFYYYNTRKSSEEFVTSGSLWRKTLLFNFAILGAILIISLVNLTSFLVSYRKDFLFYSIHAFLVFIYFSGIWLPFQGFLDFRIGRFIEIATQPLMYIAYIYFIREFLQAKINHSGFDRNLGRINFFLGVVFLLLVTSMITGYFSITGLVFTSYRIISAVLGLYIIFFITKARTKYGYFIGAGMIFISIGSLMAMFFTYKSIHIGFIRPLHWMAFGFVAEMIIYSAALGYRTFRNSKEKLVYQEALINEMKITEQLKSSKEIELKFKIQEARQKFVKEEKERLKAEFSLNEREIELSLLRNQMNPHFIFNSLNSIKSYIIKNEARVAADFLTKFAMLMRLILSNSKKKVVLLTNEIQAIRLYLELEKVRLMDKYEFEIQVDETIDPESTLIQPLILQPYVENAIWHGIRNLDGKGILKIDVSRESNQLKITISDNGVGIKRSKEINNKKTTLTKSFGLEITKERLEMHYQKNINIVFSDLFPGEQHPGTKVELFIPLETVKHE